MSNPDPPDWQHRPDGSNWGEYGADDEIGLMRFLTPAKVLEGMAEVRTGETFCLSLPLDYPGGTSLNRHRQPPRIHRPDRQGRPVMNFPLATEQPGCTDIICDESVELFTQYSTHWDSLAHVGQCFDARGDGRPEKVYYNGYRAGRDMTDGPDGKAHRLGIEKLAETCVQGRGVMIDLQFHLGDARRPVSYADLRHILDADRIEITRGDIVCLHTGYADAILAMAGTPDRDVLMGLGVGLDGRDPELLQWIDDCGLIAIACDNSAVEFVRPFVPGSATSALPLHEHCLFRRGIHLGEYWHLTPLAKRLRELGRNHFLLTAPPLRLPGATGSPVTPVATL